MIIHGNRFLVYEIAHRYIDAGISVFPLLVDGSKSPAIKSWNPYRERMATDEELASWFKRPIAALAIVAGFISNDLEVIDFDDGSLFEPWRNRVSGIVDRLPIIATPSSGYHVLYRCDEIGGNVKIAVDPNRTKKTLIETRGEGGYIAAVGSHPSVHELHRPYLQASGPDLPNIPRISPQERCELFRAARSFDLGDTAKQAIKNRQRQSTTKSTEPLDRSTPWGDFDSRADWRAILEPMGWTSRDGIHWTRPGKREGLSAKVREATNGAEVLVVFSSNAGDLSPCGDNHATFGKFHAWCKLHHGGDYKKATREASLLGYGQSDLGVDLSGLIANGGVK